MENKLDLVAIGNRIRLQREFLGFTRDYLAEQISASTNFCRDIEIGAKGMSLKTLAKISLVLKISTDYIIFGESLDNTAEPLMLMLNSCKPEKRKFAEQILKAFLLAVE
jgi:transcriptional regulator with XRE-family HTH domain